MRGVATGTDATSTDAPGKSGLTSESTGSAAAEEQTTEVKSTEKQTSENASTEKTTEKSTEKATTEKATTEKATIDTGGSAAPVTRQTQYKKVKKRKARNSCYRDLTQIALETQYPYIKVDKSYIDDALFNRLIPEWTDWRCIPDWTMQNLHIWGGPYFIWTDG